LGPERCKRLAKSEETQMKPKLLITVAAVAVAAVAMVALPSVAVAQTPPMSGGYTNVIPIPVNDPEVKAISGALFKPEGAGPFPAVIYMSSCHSLGSPLDADHEKTLIAHHLAKGLAVLVADSFTPRGAEGGVCDKMLDLTWYYTRARDAHAAGKLLAPTPGIDARHLFLEGFDHGAISALLAEDSTMPDQETKFAGVIAYDPHCGIVNSVTVPTLVLIGDKDDVTPAALCVSKKDMPNLEVVVYPGATHAFSLKGMDMSVPGHRLVYDETAAKDAQNRVDAFIAAHMTEARTQ
jgi:dienelactone hydrolase